MTDNTLATLSLLFGMLTIILFIIGIISTSIYYMLFLRAEPFNAILRSEVSVDIKQKICVQDHEGKIYWCQVVDIINQGPVFKRVKLTKVSRYLGWWYDLLSYWQDESR